MYQARSRLVTERGQCMYLRGATEYHLTVAGQHMRTSYLLPSSRSLSRYQDSRPWGCAWEGNSTGSWVGRMDSRVEMTCRLRWCKVGGTSGKVTALGPRKMVFSTLAFTVQSCKTVQSKTAMTRMFDIQHNDEDENPTTECFSGEAEQLH